MMGFLYRGLLLERAVGDVYGQLTDGDTAAHAAEGGIAFMAPAAETEGGCDSLFSHLLGYKNRG